MTEKPLCLFVMTFLKPLPGAQNAQKVPVLAENAAVFRGFEFTSDAQYQKKFILMALLSSTGMIFVSLSPNRSFQRTRV